MSRFDDTKPNYQPPPHPYPSERAQPAPLFYQEPPFYPPPVPPRKRRRPRRGVGCIGCLLRVGLALGLFSFLFAVLLIGLYMIAPPPRTNILILGVDARPGDSMVTRTDTIILATVDPQQPYVGMLSIPRDLYVNVPGFGSERINAAHLLGENAREGGGIDLAVETVEQNFGVRVDRAARLNFEAFVAIVDAAGGVTINVEDHIIDYEYPTPDYGTMVVEFQPGEQYMDGERALIYARTRHGDSDFQRAARQQQVLQALTRQLANPLDWWRLPAVYLAFVQNVDTDMTPIDAVMLLPAVMWVGPDGIDRQVLTRDMAAGTTLDNGAQILDPQWESIDQLVEFMFRQ